MKKTLLCIAKYTVLILLALIFLLPILYVFYNSLLPYRYVQTWAPISVWTLDNFKELFMQYPILKWYWNTFASTAIVVIGNLLFPTMAGYALAKLRFPGKKADLYLYADIYDGSVSADTDSDVYTACKAESA